MLPFSDVCDIMVDGDDFMKKLSLILAVLFSIFAILASFGIGAMGQINKIVVNIVDAFKVSSLEAIPFGGVSMYHLIVGIVLVVIAALITLGGLKRIANFAEKIVPIMVVLFVVGSLIIIGLNYNMIGAAFASIFKFAFTGPAIWGPTLRMGKKQISHIYIMVWILLEMMMHSYSPSQRKALCLHGRDLQTMKVQ